MIHGHTLVYMYGMLWSSMPGILVTNNSFAQELISRELILWEAWKLTKSELVSWEESLGKYFARERPAP